MSRCQSFLRPQVSGFCVFHLASKVLVLMWMFSQQMNRMMHFVLMWSQLSHATRTEAADLYKTLPKWRSTRARHLIDQRLAKDCTRVSRRDFQRVQRRPTVDLFAFKSPPLSLSTMNFTLCTSRLQGVSNRCTTGGFPSNDRSSLFHRCVSTSFVWCIRLARFMTQFPRSALSIAKKSCTPGQVSVLLPAFTRQQRRDKQSNIPFLQVSVACPLSWFFQTSVQARSR